MMFLEEAVKNLDSLDKVAQTLIDLGKRHPLHADFNQDNVYLFIQSVLSTWKSILQKKMTEECIEAWQVLLEFVLDKITQGALMKNKTGSLGDVSSTSSKSSNQST